MSAKDTQIGGQHYKDMSKAERRDMWNRACIRTYQALVESGALVVKERANA